ncbi:MAG: DUF883 family protein [Pseudomonadota bacterium]
MFDVTDLSAMNRQKVLSTLKSVVTDAEEILRASANLAGEKVVELRERMQERVRDAKLRIADVEALVVDKTKAAAHATDDFVRDNPWQAVGVAAGVGLLLGLILGRR